MGEAAAALWRIEREEAEAPVTMVPASEASSCSVTTSTVGRQSIGARKEKAAAR
jgi:hypothetical protein